MTLATALQMAPADLQDMDDSLSVRDFNRLAQLVEGKAGIKLPHNKKVMLEGRLRKRIRANGLNSFAEYCDYLFGSHGLVEELDYLIDSVTTNKTDFFREPEHFKFLQAHALPELLAARRGEIAHPILKVWSAASSNGAEAYTLAMLLHEQMELRRDFRFAILGTDISTTVLEQGRLAIYPAEMMKPVPEHLLKRYVMQSQQPQVRKEMRMAPGIRRYVKFSRLNLIDETYPFDRDVDMIFLRNVLIYFEKDEQEAVVKRLYGHLRKGGFLFLGHSESMVGSNLGLHQVARAVFQRT